MRVRLILEIPGWMIGTEAHVRVGSQVKYGVDSSEQGLDFASLQKIRLTKLEGI